MDEKTREALEGSIRKWEAIVAGTGADHGSDNCPLCQMFATNPKLRCVGCPVMAMTGALGCENSPYDELESHRDHCEADECAECRRLQIAELDFLKSLRPSP